MIETRTKGRRHRCKECGERGSFDELVDHAKKEHGFAEIGMPYRPSYPHETQQLKITEEFDGER